MVDIEKMLNEGQTPESIIEQLTMEVHQSYNEWMKTKNAKKQFCDALFEYLKSLGFNTDKLTYEWVESCEQRIRERLTAKNGVHSFGFRPVDIDKLLELFI